MVERVGILASQFAVGKALAEHLVHGQRETLTIVHVFAIVVAERLFIEVTEKMKRFHAHIRARDAAFQQRPEILKAIGVYATVCAERPT